MADIHWKTVGEVLKQYGIERQEIELIQKKFNRQVWRVAADSREYALKYVEKSSRAERIASVNNYLYSKGIPVITVLPTLDGNSFVQNEAGSFLLFPWKEGVRPCYKERGMIERVATLLAQFHEASRGYIASGGAITDYWLDWNEIYQHKIERLTDFHKCAESMGDPFSQLFLKHFQWLESRAIRVLKLLPTTSFKELMLKSRIDPLLGHGDYSHVNLILDGAGDLFVIDLDSVSIALPMQDISHLITTVNHSFGSWSVEKFQLVLNAYQSVRPLTVKEKELLLIDQVFPNKVLGLAKQHYETGSDRPLLQELECCLSIDREKLSFLDMGPYE